MMRHWEYIASALKELNLPDLAGMAQKIDAEVVKGFGDTHTSRWKHDYLKIEEKFRGAATRAQKLDLIVRLVAEPMYWVPCSADDCVVCRMPLGRCSESLVRTFVNTLIDELWRARDANL